MADRECLNCKHHKNGGCDTWCENGEVWTPTKEYIEREELLRRDKKHQGYVFGAPVIIAEIENAPNVEIYKWVRVEERYPKKGEEVLVYRNGMRDIYTYVGDGVWEDTYGYWQTDDTVSHWTELPPDPVE